MNKLKEVIQAIRKQLNHLTEIKKDCEFICNEGFRNIITNVNKEGNAISVLYFSKDSEEANDYVFSYDDFEEWNFEIIGKEPTILDFMEVVGKQLPTKTFALTDDLCLIEFDENGHLLVPNGVSLNYSKPNIIDQSENTINFLYSVLCQ